MKLLVQIVLMMVLAGCASPYRTVYTSAEGDYYIEEQAAQSTYYVPDSVLYAGIGFDPWWITANPSISFIYYNPGYYPYYLSAWYGLMYPPYYGHYGRYYSNWCPPYRNRELYAPVRANRITDSSIRPAFVDSREMNSRKNLWGSSGNKKSDQLAKPRNVPAYKSMAQPGSMTSFMNVPGDPSRSAPGIRSDRSSGLGSPSMGSDSFDRGTKMSGSSRGRDKQ